MEEGQTTTYMASPFLRNTCLLLLYAQVFVDDDGTAYHVRTGISIAELTPDMTGSCFQPAELWNGEAAV